jgi:hypothetical protein
MLIIGCDFHTRYQQIAMMDEATGELVERRRELNKLKIQSSLRDFGLCMPWPGTSLCCVPG